MIKVVHLDFEPYCNHKNKIILGDVISHGTYVCTEGLDLKLLQKLTCFKTGGDVVGMTGLPGKF